MYIPRGTATHTYYTYNIYLYRQQSNNSLDRTCNHKNLTSVLFCHIDNDYNLKYRVSLFHIYRYK